MSGLLPRTQQATDQGNFNNLTVQNLIVTAGAFISNLSVGVFSVGNLTVDNVITPLITGSPDLNIAAGNATVNGDNILTTDNTEVVTNKSISAATNTITVNTDFDPETNINDAINQRVRTDSSVDFLDVSTIGGIFAGGNGTFNNVLTNTVNDQSGTNTCLINGVNPLTTSTDLSTHVAASTAHGTTSAIVGIDDVQRLTNKNIAVPSCKLVDNSTSSKVINFLVSGATASTSTQLTCVQTANRVITFPDATTTLIGVDTTDTLTNKTLTLPVIVSISNSGTVTLPTGTRTLVARDTTDTLTNKTLTSPIIASISNTGTITLPTATTTLVGRDTTDTLSTKTIDSAGNTITITNSPLSATNVNSLINQDIRTTASPTYSALNLTNGTSSFAGVVTEFSGTLTIAAGGATTTAYTLATTSNHNYMTEFTLVGFCTSGTNAGKGAFQKALNGITNNAGAITNNIAFGNSFALNGITAAQSLNTSGTSVQHQITASAVDTIRWIWHLKVTSN